MTKNDAIQALRERFGEFHDDDACLIYKEEADALGVFDDQDDGWIEWGGGECPVDCMVEVELRSGHRGKIQAKRMLWGRFDGESEIIAYRIHREG